MIPGLSLADESKNSGQAVGAATVTQLDQVEVRAPAHGKARIQLLARGKNAFVGRLWLAAGAKVPIHKDVTEEYIIFIQGGAHTVSAGSTVYMPAGAEVTYQNGKTDTVAIQVFAGPSSADKYAQWPIVKKK
jgi:quercetin dioxygenase-like cupin family protein